MEHEGKIWELRHCCMVQVSKLQKEIQKGDTKKLKLEKYTIKIRDDNSPMPFVIECSLKDFRPQEIAFILKGVRNTIQAIMEEMEKEESKTD